MHRKTLSASRLQDEVKRRLQRLQEVVEDGVKIVVPRPQAQEPDRSGCNWTMRHFGNAAGFEASIAGVLAQVQREYNLTADAQEEADDEQATHADDPFGGTRAPASVNPFGESAPKANTNPFGGEAPAKAGDPFGASSGAAGERDAKAETPGKRPANPFGD
jgi:hypothetical protein